MSTAAPTKPDELEATLLDEKALAEMTGADGKLDPQKLSTFIHDYARETFEKDNGLRTQLKDAVEAGLRSFAEQNEGKRLPMGGDPPAGDMAIYAPLNLSKVEARQVAATGRGPGAILEGEWKSLSEFAQATWHRQISLKGLDPRLVKNDFSSLIGADGGFLVPEVLRAELMRLSLEIGIVRPRARVIPMDSLTVPFPTIDDTSHATSVYGGIIGYWTPESGQLTESQATFGRILLEAKKLTAYCEVPNELLADSIISFEAFINSAYPEALAFFEDVGFLRGSGAGEPLGVHNASVVVAVAKETGQAAATIVWENLVKVYARMLPASLGRAVWVASIDCFPELATMSLSVGTGGSAIWLNNGAAGPPMTILGLPVIFTEKMPVLGTQGDIGLYDFGYYLIGDRQAISMASSPHFKFQNDQTVYRFIERVDGRPWLQTALTPRNAGPTLSPFVQVATRA